MINLHPEAYHLAQERLEEEGGRHDDRAEEEKADDVAQAPEEPCRQTKANEGVEYLILVEIAKATPFAVQRKVSEIVRVAHGEENREVDVPQERLDEEQRENGESFNQETV